MNKSVIDIVEPDLTKVKPVENKKMSALSISICTNKSISTVKVKAMAVTEEIRTPHLSVNITKSPKIINNYE